MADVEGDSETESDGSIEAVSDELAEVEPEPVAVTVAVVECVELADSEKLGVPDGSCDRVGSLTLCVDVVDTLSGEGVEVKS